MKQGKKLTRTQKIDVSNAGLAPKNWELIKEGVALLTIRNKTSGTIRTVRKTARR